MTLPTLKVVTSGRSIPPRRSKSASAASLLQQLQHPSHYFFSRTRHATTTTTPTVWIGTSMFCLMLLYVSIVVTVTRYHLKDISFSEKTSITTSGLESNGIIPVDAKPKKKKRSPFRQHHLELGFGRGVQPDVLVPHSQQDQGSIVAVKDDPHEHPTPNNILTAFLEPEWDNWTELPLPPRAKAKKELLKPVTYPRLNSCSKLPQQWPVDDTPADADPFLPWIHDVFPTHDGKYIQFVAQNKKRCRTGRKEKHILKRMQPQVSLFQHVPVKRIPDQQQQSTTRYQLVPYEQADPDGITTRFICRFKPSMEETLSVFNFDYDWTAYRKRYKSIFLEDDGGIKSIHTTQLIFKCPVPQHLQETVRSGTSVKDDWASLFVDLIPIRTRPRFGVPHQYLAPWYQEFQATEPEHAFDPKAAWGDNYILPALDDSGRWENIPICKPSLMTYEHQDIADLPATADVAPPKKHKLVSCIWASAGYTTRGNRFAVNDGQRRLLEWISYNKIIGFDHFYLFDNSGAFGNETASLKGIADLFPGKVTYIPWPAKVCNNNPNNVDSVGERSSQYAAESSCRLRFGPHVDWIGQFDIDEYLVPMGEHKSVLSLLDKLDQQDTRIISFGSWRAWPRWAYIEEPVPINDPHECWHEGACFDLRIPLNYTMLQVYNCDRQPPGKKKQKMPAEKQIYSAEYVTQHFVHYTAATVLSGLNRSEYTKQGFEWKRRGFPDPRQRYADEITEGLMIHTKAVARQDTSNWESVCHIDNLSLPKEERGLCRLGVPWPKDLKKVAKNATEEGWAFNCYVNEKVETLFVPQLNAALKEKLHYFDQK